MESLTSVEGKSARRTIVHLKRLLLVVALCGLPMPVLAEAELEVRGWLAEIDGNLRLQEGERGTDILLPDVLGFDSEETLEFRLTWRLAGPLVLRFGYMPLGYSGDTTLSEELEFGGIVFPIEINVSSKLDIEYGRLGVGWLIEAAEKFHIGPMLEIKGMRTEAELSGSILSIPLITARESVDAGFLSIGGLFDAAPIAKLHIVGEVFYSPGLDLGEMIEAEVGLKFIPIKMLSISAGYRLIDFDLENDGDKLDLEFSGPYLGGSLTF